MNTMFPVSLAFFGKLPSRGDFVRSTNQGTLTQTLDTWMTHALEMMAQDPHWKPIYDQAPPMHFAFFGSHNRSALAGHLVASADASQRRFPFVAAGTFEIESAPEFMGRSPLVLSRLWARFEQLVGDAIAAGDASAQLAEMNHAQAQIDLSPNAYEASYRDFLDLQTVGGLQQLLQATRADVDVRRVLLGLGLLLQPVPANGSDQLEKGIRLPLPDDPLAQPYVAALWLDLASCFLAAGAFEVVVFLSQEARGGRASLSIGFAGGSPSNLHAMLDSRVGADVFVELEAPDWVDGYIDQEFAVKKLAGYLAQPRLSLRQARITFREAFLGEGS
jgi:type VI secretion system protein ImpM